MTGTAGNACEEPGHHPRDADRATPPRLAKPELLGDRRRRRVRPAHV
ncbi:MAG: hypothetical protein M3Q49_20720 [Actinomycetota bacterium]|nr:hypothetical protein [Actinomycetota bacterium]